jgi:hypothetical protein
MLSVFFFLFYGVSDLIKVRNVKRWAMPVRMVGMCRVPGGGGEGGDEWQKVNPK